MYLVGCALRLFAPFVALGVIVLSVLAWGSKAGSEWVLAGVAIGILAYVLGVLITSKADVQRANKDRAQADTRRQR